MKSIFIFMKSIFRIRSLLMDSRTILLQFQCTDRVHKQEDNIRWPLALDIPLTEEDFLWKDRERTTIVKIILFCDRRRTDSAGTMVKTPILSSSSWSIDLSVCVIIRRLHHTLENGRGFCKPLVFLLRNSGSACTCTGYLITVITQFKTRSKRTTNRSDRTRCQRNKILLFNLKSTS